MLGAARNRDIFQIRIAVLIKLVRLMRVCIVIALMLRMAGTASASEHNVHALVRVSDYVRMLGGPSARSASIVLSVTGRAALEPVKSGVSSQNWKVRYWTAATLGHIRGGTIRQELSALAQDRDWRVKLSAILAWGEAFGGDTTLPGLKTGLSSSSTNEAIREASGLFTEDAGNTDHIRRTLQDIEGGAVRLLALLPNISKEPTHLDFIRFAGVYAQLYVANMRDGSEGYVEWSNGGYAFDQVIRFPDTWKITYTPAAFAVRIGGKPSLTIRLMRFSASYNFSAPACYLLSSNKWKLLNQDLANYSSDDYGDFFFNNNRLYVYQGNMGAHGRADLQSFTLREFNVSGQTMTLVSKRTTKRLYDPHGKDNLLAEFGFKRLMSWNDTVPKSIL